MRIKSLWNLEQFRSISPAFPTAKSFGTPIMTPGVANKIATSAPETESSNPLEPLKTDSVQQLITQLVRTPVKRFHCLQHKWIATDYKQPCVKPLNTQHALSSSKNLILDNTPSSLRLQLFCKYGHLELLWMKKPRNVSRSTIASIITNTSKHYKQPLHNNWLMFVFERKLPVFI